jgi:hypothetical protein
MQVQNRTVTKSCLEINEPEKKLSAEDLRRIVIVVMSDSTLFKGVDTVKSYSSVR